MRASEIYQALAQQAGNEDINIRINLNAAYAQSVWKGDGNLISKTKAEREDLEGFETAYNAACLLIARGELGQAEVLLKRARGLIISICSSISLTIIQIYAAWQMSSLLNKSKKNF